MPVPIQAALRYDPRPREANSERALLEQRARRALADERPHRPHHAGESTRRSQSGAEWHSAPVRLACAVLLLVVGLGAMASKASAMPASSPHMTVAGRGEMRSGGGQILPTAI